MADQAGHDEIVLFTEKPNALFYALEVTRQGLLVGGLAGLVSGIPLLSGVFGSDGSLLRTGVLIIFAFFLLGFLASIVAVLTARHLTFVVTNRRAIVRWSSRRTTTDEISIAVESVKRIEINSRGEAYGSVFLSCDEILPRENDKGGASSYSQPGATQRASIEFAEALVPIKRTDSIWGPKSTWPGLFGFYGFKRFDEFAKIIIEQKRLRSEFQGRR